MRGLIFFVCIISLLSCEEQESALISSKPADLPELYIVVRGGRICGKTISHCILKKELDNIRISFYSEDPTRFFSEIRTTDNVLLAKGGIEKFDESTSLVIYKFDDFNATLRAGSSVLRFGLIDDKTMVKEYIITSSCDDMNSRQEGC